MTFNTNGKKIGQNYAVALMVEDFYYGLSDVPLSSVGIQFLVQIVDRTSCSSKPTINSTALTNTTITVGNTFLFNITAQTNCSGRTISDILTLSPLHMEKSNMITDPTGKISTITESWTPTADQIGSTVFRASATDRLTLN